MNLRHTFVRHSRLRLAILYGGIYVAILSGNQLPVLVGAKRSLLANNEEGTPSSRCLPRERKPILPDIPHVKSKLLPVMLEENNWATHYLITAVAGIIISEHIGHPLTYNVAGKLSRAYHRVAMPANRIGHGRWREIVQFDPENDGSQLKQMLEDDVHFAYANLEVWTGTKREQLQHFVDDLGAVRIVGSIGYHAREGWFVPKCLVDHCGALAYPSWLPDNDHEIQQAFGNASELWTLGSNPSLVKCYSGPATSDCELWLKNDITQGPQIFVHAINGYGGTFQEAFVKNNNLNVAIRFHSYSDQINYVRNRLNDNQTNCACGGGAGPKAFAFYHWEPSSDLSSNEWAAVERIVLPGRRCGTHPTPESLEDWRCDFEPERLTKIRSKRIASRAPLIEQFLRKFQVRPLDLANMLKALEVQKGGPESPLTHDAIFTVACNWVKANEQIWGTWTYDRKQPILVPFFAFTWDPLVFFLCFFWIVLTSVICCLCFDGLFVSNRGLRKKWNWKYDFVPRLLPDLSKFFQSAPIAKADIMEIQSEETALQECARSVVMFAAAVFYDLNSPEPLTVSVCLIRIGFCGDAADVKLTTVDGTALAGVHYTSLDTIVRFEATEQVKWVPLKLIKSCVWANEQFFHVSITNVVSGSVLIGRLRQCNCVLTDLRYYPGLDTYIETNTTKGRVQFAWALLLDFANIHGKVAEAVRILWISYEAFVESVIKPLLYGLFLLDYCIASRNYYGFFILAGVEVLDGFLQRLSTSHQLHYAAGDFRISLHKLCGRKHTTPFFLSLSSRGSEWHFMNCHTYSTDLGAGFLYSCLYKTYKAILELIMAIVLNFELSNMAKGGHPILAVYQFVPLIIMIPVCLRYGLFWQRKWRWNQTVQHEKSREERVKMASWLAQVKHTTTAFGLGYLRKECDLDFSKAVQIEFRDDKQEKLQEMDSKWLSSSFANFIIVGLWVTLGLVLIESQTYGVGDFTLGALISTLGIYNVLKIATIDLCESIAYIENAIAMLNNTREFLDQGKNVAATASRQDICMAQCGIKSPPFLHLPESLSCCFERALAEDSLGHLRCFNGVVPLGRLYFMSTDATEHETFTLFALWQTSLLPMSGNVSVPPFVRVVVLHGSQLPELLHRSAIENALVFTDTKRFSASHARQLLKQFEVLGDRSAGPRPGDQIDVLDMPLDPATVSVEDQMLITLVQVILADPEVILFNKCLSIPARLHARVLSALVAWQGGGPQAVLCSQDLSSAGAYFGRDGFPDWMNSDGTIARTLLLNADAGVDLESKIKPYVAPYLVPELLRLESGEITVGKRSHDIDQLHEHDHSFSESAVNWDTQSERQAGITFKTRSSKRVAEKLNDR